MTFSFRPIRDRRRHFQLISRPTAPNNVKRSYKQKKTCLLNKRHETSAYVQAINMSQPQFPNLKTRPGNWSNKSMMTKDRGGVGAGWGEGGGWGLGVEMVEGDAGHDFPQRVTIATERMAVLLIVYTGYSYYSMIKWPTNCAYWKSQRRRNLQALGYFNIYNLHERDSP